MSANEIINAALKRGAKEGLGALTLVERKVFLISEAELLCDMEGIDMFLRRYGVVLTEAAEAFADIGADEIALCLRSIHAAGPQCANDLLERADQLILSRTGYDYEAIERFVSNAT